jgi:hypothetical protein
MFLSMDNV